MVGGLGEVSGGYNLQNLAWTFADVVTLALTPGGWAHDS